MPFELHRRENAPPSQPPWRGGRKLVFWIDTLGQLAWFLTASLIVDFVERREPFLVVACVLLFVSAVLLDRMDSDDKRSTIAGAAGMAIGVIMSLVSGTVADAVVLAALVGFILARRLLDAIRTADKHRVVEALAHNRDIMLNVDRKQFSERIAIELDTPQMRANLSREIRCLAKTTRRSFVVFGRLLHATTDEDANNFGAQAFEDWQRKLAASTLAGDLRAAIVPFAAVVIVTTIGHRAFFP